MAPIPELTATLRVLVVPWALPSSECECEVLTVEAPYLIRTDHICDGSLFAGCRPATR